MVDRGSANYQKGKANLHTKLDVCGCGWQSPPLSKVVVAWLYRRFPGKTFPGKTFSGQDLSRTRPFQDNHFPGQTFPGQVRPILWNFHVHNVCKYQLYRPSHTICRYTGRLLMCSRHWPRTVKKTGHSDHQLTNPNKHTDFMNAIAVSLYIVSINEQLNSADWVGLKWLCEVA